MSVHLHLKVKMRSCAVAGISRKRNHLALFDPLAGFHLQLRIMRVQGPEALSVIDEHCFSVPAAIAGENHFPAGGGFHAAARLHANIDPFVKDPPEPQRMKPIAEGTGDPAVQRPLGRKMLHQPLIAIYLPQQLL